MEIAKCPVCGRKITDDKSILKGRQGCKGSHSPDEIHNCAKCGKQCLKRYEVCLDCFKKTKDGETDNKKSELGNKATNPEQIIQDKILALIKSHSEGISNANIMLKINCPDTDKLGALFYLRQIGKIKTIVTLKTNNVLHQPKVYYTLVPKSKIKKEVKEDTKEKYVCRQCGYEQDTKPEVEAYCNQCAIDKGLMSNPVDSKTEHQ